MRDTSIIKVTIAASANIAFFREDDTTYTGIGGISTGTTVEPCVYTRWKQ